MREIAERLRARAGITRTTGIAVACAGLTLGALTPAHADDDVPSAERVESAKNDADAAARDVGAIKARLVAANERVDSLGYEAAAVAEAYNGARYRLAGAKQAARRSAKRSAAAANEVETQRKVVSALTVQGLQQSSDLNRMTALFDSEGPAKLLEQTSAYGSTNEALTAELGAYESKKSVARLLAERGAKALKKQQKLAAEAQSAKADVDAAVAESERAVSSIGSEKTKLIRQLAKAQGISVGVARSRQDALERRAEARAVNAPAEPEPSRSRGPAPAASGSSNNGNDNDNDNDNGEGEGEGDGGGESARDEAPSSPDVRPARRAKPKPSSPDPRPARQPKPKPKPSARPQETRDPAPSGGADRAIAYAKRQLGEPYVYGAAGPSSWDCSGLTMRAWGAAGKSLPHFSGAQYAAGRRVSVGSIRKGDVLFWSNGGPGSIYHVALYLGGGKMIHSPRPGRSVEIVSVGYWIAPDLAARY